MNRTATALVSGLLLSIAFTWFQLWRVSEAALSVPASRLSSAEYGQNNYGADPRSIRNRVEQWSTEAVDASRVEDAIHAAATYLKRNTTDSGQFVYRVQLDDPSHSERKYNVLRHAGATYALAMYYRRSPDAATWDALLRSSHFLRAKTMDPVPGHDDMLAVWSEPALTGSAGPRVAKLGGAGLALVALAHLHELDSSTVSLDELKQLGNFILHMQKEDGSFCSKYIPDEGGRSDSWVSLYYPGEAALGLMLLFELDPQPQWLHGAFNAIACLARRRAGQTQVEADHWALLASARLWPRLDSVGRDEAHDLVLGHTVQICESILAEQPPFPQGVDEWGGFTLDGRTCPTATRLEGLLAAYTILPSEHQRLRERIWSSSLRGIDFMLRAQIPAGQHAGAVPRGIRRLPPGHSLWSHAFNRRAKEVRIDYVQHCLSAMIQFAQLAEHTAAHDGQ